ncbi:MAG: fumarylacetoacetate hydrolase family protein, partial [Myxococcales bacterium]|nr:fumarylacetoacetate hydrolase family protein [Myxococcales bacterium]
MRIASLLIDGQPKLGVRKGQSYLLVSDVDPTLGTDVGLCLASGDDWALRAAEAAKTARAVELDAVRHRPLVPNPPKLLCLGLNDVDHAAEGGFDVPDFPAVFARIASSLIGHREPMLRPRESEQLDYECELAVVIGRAGRRIPEEQALDHVAGYTVFNDG